MKDQTNRTCAAVGCEVDVSGDWLMCRRHWAMVPEKVQLDIWDAQRGHRHAELMTVISTARRIAFQREEELGRRCRSCGRPIFFAELVEARMPVPIDESPSADGVLVVRPGTSTAKLYAKRFGDGPPVEGEERYSCHLDTCPVSVGWRKAADT